MANLELYNKVRAVPDSAKKKISGGRLNGMTDINPMWRIKILTENFGVCGIGWKYEIVKQWLEDGANDEKVSFTHLNLYIKNGDGWSDPIPGVGGSSFITKERNGMYTSDECHKMSLTDALSVACKALGIGADVYFEKDRTKYDKEETKAPAIPNYSDELKLAKTVADVKAIWDKYPNLHSDRKFTETITAKKNEVTQK